MFKSARREAKLVRSEVVAIVPAAGLSKRYGGPNKLLQPWGKSTVVGTVVQTLLALEIDVLVVTGRDADLIEAAVFPAHCTHNPDYKLGLGTSLAWGVRHGGEPSLGFLIALADMPCLRPDVVTTLIESARRDKIIAPVYAQEPDRPGHPVFFGAAFVPDLVALTGDVGARAVIHGHRDSLELIPVEGALPDLDGPSIGPGRR